MVIKKSSVQQQITAISKFICLKIKKANIARTAQRRSQITIRRRVCRRGRVQHIFLKQETVQSQVNKNKTKKPTATIAIEELKQHNKQA